MGNKQVNSVCMMESSYFFVSMEFYVKFGRTTKIMLSEKQAVGKVVEDIFQVLTCFHVF